MSHWEFEIVAALAFACALLLSAYKDWKWYRGGVSDFLGFLLLFGILFWPVLIGWWLVRTLILTVG